MKKICSLAIFVLFVSSSACSFSSNLPAGGDSSVDNVLFQDDFSDETSGWPQVRDKEGITDYENGVYRILVSLENQDYFGTLDLSLQANLRVEVDAAKVGGSDDNDFGILCRYQDHNNYYQFLISSDGYAGILKYVDGSMQNIAGDTLIEHAAINMGDAQNHIRADCIGNTFALYVNDQQVLTGQDSTFVNGGDVGLFAGTYDIPGTDIHFDNFVVTAP